MFSFFRSHGSDVRVPYEVLSFRATLGVASLFMSSYGQDGELGDAPPPISGYFFGFNLDYLDFSSGIFDL